MCTKLYSVQSDVCQIAGERLDWQQDKVAGGRLPGDWPRGEELYYLATSEGQPTGWNLGT